MDYRHGLGMDVPPWFFAKIGLIGDLGMLITVAGENTFSVGTLGGEPKAADAAKKVDESKIGWRGRVRRFVGNRVLMEDRSVYGKGGREAVIVHPGAVPSGARLLADL